MNPSPDESTVFQCFLGYDFINDVNFQNGWKQISSKIPQEEIPSHLYRAKHFYFNKNVAPVDEHRLKEWMKLQESLEPLEPRHPGIEYLDRDNVNEFVAEKKDGKGRVKMGEVNEKNHMEVLRDGEEEEDVESKNVRKEKIQNSEKILEQDEDLNMCSSKKDTKDFIDETDVSGTGDQTKNIQVTDIDLDGKRSDDVAVVMETRKLEDKNSEKIRGTDAGKKKDAGEGSLTQNIVEKPNLEEINSTCNDECREKLDKESYDNVKDEINLTFGEIMTLIQSGETIPGMKCVDVQPTNNQPSPSLLPQLKKPWQTD